MSRRSPTWCGGFLFVRIVIDMKDQFGYNTRMNKQEDIVILSVHDHKKLKESIMELQVTVGTYKDAIKKLIIEKDLLLSIVKGGQIR